MLYGYLMRQDPPRLSAARSNAPRSPGWIKNIIIMSSGKDRRRILWKREEERLIFVMREQEIKRASFFRT